MPSKRTANLALAEDEDLTRSLADWNAFRLPSLRLKCNQYSLSEKGNKDEIIERLIEHMKKLEEESLLKIGLEFKSPVILDRIKSS